jgi:putative tricarboxylic transport membrane protein
MKKHLLFTVLLASSTALAQGFTPTRPIELVVHTGPGGGSDVLARAMVIMLEKEKLLPVRAQVANKPGGGGVVAAAYLAEKKGETHTIGIFTGVWLTNPLTSNEAKVSLKDLTPIARLLLEPAVIAVKADAPYKTLADFVNAAKQKPGELKQSGGSITSRDNVVRQQLQKATGTRWQFISFPGGGERIAALLGGHVNMMVIEPNEAGEHIRAGNMRLLAQVNDTRLSAFPNVPTLKEEMGIDYATGAWRGFAGPKGLPADIATKLTAALKKANESKEYRDFMSSRGFGVKWADAQGFATFMDAGDEQMGKAMKAAGLAKA